MTCTSVSKIIHFPRSTKHFLSSDNYAHVIFRKTLHSLPYYNDFTTLGKNYIVYIEKMHYTHMSSFLFKKTLVIHFFIYN